MNKSEQDELREWIKANLVIEIDHTSYSNDVYVCLSFINDRDPFSRCHIHIPDDAP